MTKRIQNKEYYADYYENNKEKVKLKRAEWRKNNKEHISEKGKAYRKENKGVSQKWRDDNKDKLYFLSLKARAKRKGLEFHLDENDVLGVTVCPVFGFPLVRSLGRPSWNSPSLDRIDNTKGYVKGNIQIMSYLANSMKRDATDEQLVAFAYWILKEKQKKEPL